MKKIVFYSWQSDLPNATNRNLIEDALKSASSEIEDEAILIDRDTKGMPGAPDIASTILAKIEAADVFVADVSIISKPKKGRPTPNPNVLIELGYALKTLGHERMVLVFNGAFGGTMDLPFDLRTRRLLVYNCPDKTPDRSPVKKELAKDFKAALISSFSHPLKKDEKTNIIEIIQQNPPYKIIELRKYLSSLFEELKALQPKMSRDGGTVEELIEAISQSQVPLVAFSKLCESVTLMKDMVSAEEIFKWFGLIYENYYPATNESGRYSEADGDFFKFLGHEMFVIFISYFLREEKWVALEKILKWKFKSEMKRRNQEMEKNSWTVLSAHSPLLEIETKKRNRLDFHSDLLYDRHGQGGLASTTSFKDFSEADFLLFLYGEGQIGEAPIKDWYPRSIVWFSHTPFFIKEAENYPFAMQVCRSLNISDIEELKKRLAALSKIRRLDFSPISLGSINKIGNSGGAQIIN